MTLKRPLWVVYPVVLFLLSPQMPLNLDPCSEGICKACVCLRSICCWILAGGESRHHRTPLDNKKFGGLALVTFIGHLGP